ncbi:unnamed protein product [Amoebophrya sp. A120]|nr:unnamed protein product [Amoebophrya sp. A120]|eukprot:GSA120T00013999001.1
MSNQYRQDSNPRYVSKYRSYAKNWVLAELGESCELTCAKSGNRVCNAKELLKLTSVEKVDLALAEALGEKIEVGSDGSLSHGLQTGCATAANNPDRGSNNHSSARNYPGVPALSWPGTCSYYTSAANNVIGRHIRTDGTVPLATENVEVTVTTCDIAGAGDGGVASLKVKLFERTATGSGTATEHILSFSLVNDNAAYTQTATGLAGSISRVTVYVVTTSVSDLSTWGVCIEKIHIDTLGPINFGSRFWFKGAVRNEFDGVPELMVTGGTGPANWPAEYKQAFIYVNPNYDHGMVCSAKPAYPKHDRPICYCDHYEILANAGEEVKVGDALVSRGWPAFPQWQMVTAGTYQTDAEAGTYSEYLTVLNAANQIKVINAGPQVASSMGVASFWIKPFSSGKTKVTSYHRSLNYDADEEEIPAVSSDTAWQDVLCAVHMKVRMEYPSQTGITVGDTAECAALGSCNSASGDDSLFYWFSGRTEGPKERAVDASFAAHTGSGGGATWSTWLPLTKYEHRFVTSDIVLLNLGVREDGLQIAALKLECSQGSAAWVKVSAWR